MGEETKEEAPKKEAAPKKEEKPKKEKAPKVKKERPPREGPIISFTGPEGAPKIVALMGALTTILTGNTIFWAGGLGILWGIFLYILGLVLILVIDILDYGDPTLRKIEALEKLYQWWVLLIFGVLILLIELAAISFMVISAAAIYTLFSGILVILAMILELMIQKEKLMKPSKLVCIAGIVFALIEVVLLFSNPVFANVWDGIVGIIVVILLLLSMYEKIKFIPYQWWMVLILGFILYGWVGMTGGTIILISFILMLLEK